MKKIKLLLIMVLITGSIFGQTTNEATNTLNNKSLSLGFQAGFTTGVGFSLKKTFASGKYSLSTTITPPFFRYGKITFSSLGLTGYYNIKNSDRARLFSYLSVATFYRDKLVRSGCVYYENYTPEVCTYSYKVDAKLNMGVGLGFEISVYDVAFQLMLGYRVNTGTLQTPSTKLSIEAGITYYLK